MATTEREITEPVDLCTADGRRLAPLARGWSRQPLHRANLAGRWGRTKRWDYWAVLAGDLVLSVTVADVDLVGIADVWWAELDTGRTGGRQLVTALGRGVELPEVSGAEPVHVAGRHLDLGLVTDERGATRLTGRWRDAGGAPGRLDVVVEQPEGHESLNVVVPWSERTFQYTSKHQARPARGELVVGDQAWPIGGPAGEAWGVLDVGRGRWPYATRWNWGGGAGVADDGGTVVGLQLGGQWTVGTGATENGVLVDGRLTKIGAELDWTYDWDHPLEPWRVTAPDGSVDLVLTPRYDRHSRTDVLVAQQEVHQVFGTWSGTVVPDDGGAISFDGLQGFAEECRSRW